MISQGLLCCLLSVTIAVIGVNGDTNFAGASVSSDSSGTRSVLVSGRNGAAGVGVVSPRFGSSVPVPGVRVGSGPGYGGTYASAGPGGASASAGPGGAYAGAGGAYAGAGGAYAGANPWAFPYWNNGGGAYAGAPDYYDDEFIFGSGNRYGGGSGSGVGVYSSSDSNGISTRFASVGPGGHATIVEQNGNQPPRVYNYKGVDSSSKGTREAKK